MAEIEAENKKLISEYKELQRQDILCCDDKQWFTEVEEEIIKKRRPKIVEKQLIGRKHWNEDFTDEGTGETVTIERSQVVRINGEWL